MKIDFDNNELKKCANNDIYRQRKMGAVRGRIYKQRLDELNTADSYEDLRYLPGNYHELKNVRKGQWAVDMDNPYRLVFEPQELPVPVDSSGKYVWSEIRSVRIIEIINYHKEK